MGAQEKHPQRSGWGEARLATPRVAPKEGCSARLPLARNNCFQVGDIQGVIHFPAIGDAAVLAQECGLQQPAQVVGNQVLGLPGNGSQLLDAQVAVGKRLEHLPAQVMRQELQEARRMGGSSIIGIPNNKSNYIVSNYIDIIS